jgi:hypothetical protein
MRKQRLLRDEVARLTQRRAKNGRSGARSIVLPSLSTGAEPTDEPDRVANFGSEHQSSSRPFFIRESSPRDR